MAGCLFCSTPLRCTFVDLGKSPLCESYLAADQLNQMEPFYPLHAYVCEKCFLVQVQEYVSPEGIFTEYAYFSSYSDGWLAHAKAYVDMITECLGLGVHEPGHRAGQQRWLPAPVLFDQGHLRSRRRAGEERRHGGDRQRSAHGHEAVRSRDRAGVGRAGQGCRSHLWRQRACPGARCQRFRRRDEALAETSGRHHHRVPASHAPDRGEPVRHDLSRTLLLFLAPDGRTHLRGSRTDPVRRRGAADAWRLASHLRASRRRLEPIRERAYHPAPRSGGGERLQSPRAVHIVR